MATTKEAFEGFCHSFVGNKGRASDLFSEQTQIFRTVMPTVLQPWQYELADETFLIMTRVVIGVHLLYGVDVEKAVNVIYEGGTLAIREPAINQIQRAHKTIRDRAGISFIYNTHLYSKMDEAGRMRAFSWVQAGVGVYLVRRHLPITCW